MTMPPPPGPEPHQPYPPQAYPGHPVPYPMAQAAPAGPYAPAGSAAYGPPLPPHPPQQPRRRRGAVAATVGALVLALTAGAAATWWLTRDGDDGPLAGRPRVEDTKAGLTYGIPDGWKESEGKMIDAFTSGIAKEGESGMDTGEKGGGAMVAAGRGEGVPESAMRRQTEVYAASNAEFFFPYGKRKTEESQATKVGDRPAHTVALRVKKEDGSTGQLRFTLVALSGDRVAFLVGIADTADEGPRREVDTVLESAEVK